jgi:hypothetical protein
MDHRRLLCPSAFWLRRVALGVILALAGGIPSAPAQPQAAAPVPADPQREARLALVPTPQELQFAAAGVFQMGSTLAVSGPPAAADIVRDVLAERLGLKVLAEGTGGVTVSAPQDAADAVWTHEQAYRLSVTPGGIRIEAAAREGFFYAAQTLAQLIESGPALPALDLRDWPALRTRLVMIATDQGGFQVIEVDYWKRLIRELAALKVNAIMPYFDAGTYKYRKYPFLGEKGDDGFTLEKAQVLSEYAARHFIELIPQQNSIGHLGGALGHKELQHLRDGGGTINMVLPESLVFLGDLYDELAEAFPQARAIHVGGDEFGYDFGKHPAVAARVAEVGKTAVYAEFMTKVHELLRQRQRGMMIWWNEQGFTTDAAPLLAKDIAVFDWHYGPQADYPSLDALAKVGFSNVWATPAVTRYYDGANDWIGTFGNIGGFARAAAKRNVPGICTCTWVHGMWGGRNLFELNLYGLVYSAESAWNPERAIEAPEFGRRFAAHWVGYRGPDAGARVMQGIHAPYGERSAQKFWRDNRSLETYVGSPLMAVAETAASSATMAADARALLGYCDQADAALDALLAGATRNQVTLSYFKHDVRIHRLAAKRILAALELARWCGTVQAPKPVIEREVLKTDFAAGELVGPLKLVPPGASCVDGALVTAPQPLWKRQGLTVGPLPLPAGGVLVEYDLRPRRFGQQFQQFASLRPSTHHYMVFIGPDRRFHVYTRSAQDWAEQNTLGGPCVADRWLRCSAVLKRDGFSFRAVDRESGAVVCRSGLVPMDDPGAEVLFDLADDGGDSAVGEAASEWDHLTVSALAAPPLRVAPPPPGLLDALKGLEAEHLIIEATFRRSVREAGGGSADTGALGKGATQFRSRQGRENTARIIQDLEAGRLPSGYGE